MYRRSSIIDTWPHLGGENYRERELRGRIPGRRRIKPMNTPRELKALISYLRQQEAGVLDAFQRLQMLNEQESAF